jgi:drug/metabolite transporter (DMT)-like permease
MISVLFGLLAALSWSCHDLLARRFAGETGPFRLSFWIMLAGALVLAIPVLWRGQIWRADTASVTMALSMGLVYAFAIGGLLKAFSLAPVSIVGPLTAGYPALVVIWGLLNDLVPTLLQWSGIALILIGVTIVCRNEADQNGAVAVAPGAMPMVVGCSLIASFSFAAAVIMGQHATYGLGEYEVTFLSRFPAALLLLIPMQRDRALQTSFTMKTLCAVFAMAICDCIAVTAINASAWFPNKELGAMAIASYGAMSVMMAMLLLKEKVSLPQWLGIILVVLGVAAISV